MKLLNNLSNRPLPARFGVNSACEIRTSSRVYSEFAAAFALTCCTRQRVFQGAVNAVKALLTMVLLVTASGCSGIEPWVKPYERDRLADPIMILDANPVSSAYIQHVYEAREGARGGEGAAGGGCGCN